MAKKKRKGMSCANFIATVLVGIVLTFAGLMWLGSSTLDSDVTDNSNENGEIEGVATMIQSSSTRIDDLFLGVDEVDTVTVASERERDTQVNGLAMVTIATDTNIIESRDAMWDVWANHAEGLYPDKRLVLDLTIMQGSTETIWQFTSNSVEWLQLK